MVFQSLKITFHFDLSHFWSQASGLAFPRAAASFDCDCHLEKLSLLCGAQLTGALHISSIMKDETRLCSQHGWCTEQQQQHSTLWKSLTMQLNMNFYPERGKQSVFCFQTKLLLCSKFFFFWCFMQLWASFRCYPWLKLICTFAPPQLLTTVHL